MVDRLEWNPAYRVAHGLYYEPGGQCRPLPLPSIVGEAIMEPGSITPATRRAAVVAVEIVQRIAPWCAVAVAPWIVGAVWDERMQRQHLARREGGHLASFLGFYHSPSDTIGLAATNAQQILATAAHEAWHAIDRHLTDEAREGVNDGLRPAMYGDGYMSSPYERRARAFAGWCERAFQGLPPVYPASVIECTFDAAWAGRIGAEIAGIPYVEDQKA